MRLRDLLNPATVRIPLVAKTKADALTELTTLVVAQPSHAAQMGVITEALLAREKLMSTGIGQGIAIPHAEVEATLPAIAAVGIAPEGIAYDAPDGEPVTILFLMVVGREQSHERIEILSILSRIFRRSEVRDEIRASKTPEDLIAIFDREERAIRRQGPAGTPA